jgi:low affinity Fe/Cu permease
VYLLGVVTIRATASAVKEHDKAKGNKAKSNKAKGSKAKGSKANTSQADAESSDLFRRLACEAANKFGSPWAFTGAMLLVVVWAACGPLFDFSETWQLVINTGTTIVTFLMVFLIQSSQNRDAKAIHLKLDELIRSSTARNVFADLENATEQELDEFQREFEQLRKRGIKGDDAMIEAHRNVLANSDEKDDGR